LIIIILIFLYSGIATPAEVGAIGAFISLVIGISLRRLNLAGILDALMNTISTTGMIFMIFLGANIFGLFITLSGVPQQVIAFVTDMNINRWIVVSGIVVAYFVISMFMDEIPLLLLTLQITFPLIIALGFDPIWYGVLTMMMVSMGMVFPPVGINAFIVSAVTKVDLVKVYTGTSILMLAIVFTTILIIIFPQLAIWLPSTMR
jgi:TRAP-type C4-dicarboxylate transport system permease large subunit